MNKVKVGQKITIEVDRRKGDQRSEAIREIVSVRPGFVIRWANVFFLLILASLVIASFFIRYPDTVLATASLTSINAPKPVLSLIEGKLVKLNVTENQNVRKGDVLGYIESTASHDDVLALRKTLDSIYRSVLDDKPVKYNSLESMRLGELQSNFQVFSQAMLSFDNYSADGFFQRKRQILQRDKNSLVKLYDNLMEQMDLQEEDVDLAQKTFETNKILKDQQVISDVDFRLEQSKLIGKKMTVPQLKASIIANELQQIEKDKELMELENAIRQQKQVFVEALSTIKSQVDDWKRRYVLTAPIDGSVLFSSFVQANQQLHANESFCFINPSNTQYFAEVVVPQVNFGKVKPGQLVLLKFHSYPFQEYGSIMGTVDFISNIPVEAGYRARINFPNGLVTSHGVQIHYRDGLLANAEIVTRDMTIIERLYYSVVKHVSR